MTGPLLLALAGAALLAFHVAGGRRPGREPYTVVHYRAGARLAWDLTIGAAAVLLMCGRLVPKPKPRYRRRPRRR